MEMKKKGVVTDYLPWLIIAIAVLVIVMLAFFLLKGKGLAAIEQLKNILRG